MLVNNDNFLILQMGSLKARNIIRGIIGESDTRVIQNALDNIKICCSTLDYKEAIEVIRSSKLFKTNKICRDFPENYTVGLSEVLIYSDKEVIDKFIIYSDKLKIALKNTNEIYQLIIEKDYNKAITAIESAIKTFGVSILFLRLLIFIRNRILDEESSVRDKIDILLSNCNVENIRYIESAIKELSNSKTDYLLITKKINNSKNKSVHSYISKDFVDHIPRSYNVYEKTLSSYYSISVLDALLYYFRVMTFNFDFCKSNECLDELYKYQSVIENIKINPNIFYPLSNSEYNDLYFFKESFLLIENKNIKNYKTIGSTLYNEINNKKIIRNSYERRLVTEYFYSVKGLNDLRTNINDCVIKTNEYIKNSCGYLSNSIALIYLIENNRDIIYNDEKKFVSLMSDTRDISSICPESYLNEMKIRVTSDELKLVVLCLLSIKNKTSSSEHGLRKIIQKICISNFDGNMVKLMEYIYSISSSVADNLVQICDETFLSKLFLMTNKPVAAIEQRAEILEWYGDFLNDLTYTERAKNLRIDVQISKEKGTFDDNRIYVDPVRFVQWINDHINNELTLLLDGNTEGLPSNINWKNVKNGLHPSEQIIALLMRCYEEFCNNNIFGIASYLGRRIRHGTFKGTGSKEVKEFSNDDNYENLFKYRDFSESYKRWLDSYLDVLDVLMEDNLHIRSKKKPRGIIVDQLNTNSKIIMAKLLYSEISNSYLKNKGNVELPYIITEYCWRFIEEDLSAFRKILMEKKSGYAIFNYKIENLNYYEQNLINKKEIQEFCRGINSITTEKFRIMSEWFKKPSIASPTTDIVLLFKAVISETKGVINDFLPNIKLDDNSYEISGGAYFAIYDAFQIIIYNAAIHGKKYGKIQLNITSDSDSRSIKISIITEVLSLIKLNQAKGKITKYLKDNDINANMFEGKSGIKKLKIMESQNYIHNVNYDYNNCALEIISSFDFSLEF